jgi:hypothetical protein
LPNDVVQCGRKVLLALAVLHSTMPSDSAVHCRMRMGVRLPAQMK